MVKISNKVILGIVMVGLICVVGFKGYAQTVDEKEGGETFQDAMNAVLWPEEFPLYELSNQEIEMYVLPKAAEIIAKAIKLVYERSGNHIDVEDIFSVLPPNVEEILDPSRESIIFEVKEIIEGE